MASDTDKTGLTKLLESGNSKKCLKFFAGMPEKTRREYFPVVKSFWSRMRKVQFVEEPNGSLTWNPLDGISRLAYFATATGSEIIKAKRAGYPEADAAFEIVADRRPDWVNQWIASLLGESYFWNHWRLIRRLILAGLAEKPDSPRYYLGMISALNSRARDVNLAAEFDKDPDLLQDEVWKLFEYDGEGENSLANTERFDQSWIEAFLKLIKQGKLSRAKLLDAAVAALERDFNHYRAKWYFDFFDRLEPSDQELAGFQERLVGLLSVSAPNVVSWAIDRVSRLADGISVDSQRLCHAVEPALRARAKGTVLACLNLLERQAASQPQDSRLIASTALQALAHEGADVQKATLKLLSKLSADCDETIRQAVSKLQPTLAASVRPAAAGWLAGGNNANQARQGGANSKSTQPGAKKSASPPAKLAATKPEPVKISPALASLFAIETLQENLRQGVFSIPAAVFEGTEIPRLCRAQPIEPITSIEDLIDCCARVVEDGSLTDDVERCLDGLTRMGNDKPANFAAMAAPLLKRIGKLISKGNIPFCGVDPAHDVMGLFYAFCTGKVIDPSTQSGEQGIAFEGAKLKAPYVHVREPIGFLSAHCLAVAKRIAAGECFQLLSTPTHAGGWIDPRVLAIRVIAFAGNDPHLQDVILAMLRLAPEGRATTLKLLKNTTTEWSRAIRHAMGDKGMVPGDQAALWSAAARSRAPWSDDPAVAKKHPGLGPDAAQAAKLKFQIKSHASGGYTFYESSFLTTPAMPRDVNPQLVTVAMFNDSTADQKHWYRFTEFAGRTTGAVRWTATIWPVARESFFASATELCFQNLDWSSAEWHHRNLLEPMIDSGTPLRHAGQLFLVGMLAAKEPGESGLATDIAIRAIADGRLGSDNLGTALAELLPTGLIKPGRWSKTLAEVARASTVHRAVVQLALQHCFENRKQELPKDSSKLLELLYELSLELGVPLTNGPCRAGLAAIELTGKAAKTVRDLLALEDTADARQTWRWIMEQVVVLRADAASGWEWDGQE